MPLPANDRVALVRVKIDRAKEHVQNLYVAIRAFLDSSPYSVAFDSNFQTDGLEWRLTKSAVIPTTISATAGDVIQNLRSALDHMVWLLVLANGGTPKIFTGFPIAKSAEQYGSPEFRRKIKGMRAEAINAIDAYKPYQGGNETLWRLHCLNNIDKHRLLLSAACAMGFHDLLPSQREKITKIFFGSHPSASSAPDLRGVKVRPENARFPLEVGQVFFSMPKSEMEHNFTFTLDIAFNEPGVAEGELVFETVKRFSDLVENIVSNFAPFLG